MLPLGISNVTSLSYLRHQFPFYIKYKITKIHLKKIHVYSKVLRQMWETGELNGLGSFFFFLNTLLP